MTRRPGRCLALTLALLLVAAACGGDDPPQVLRTPEPTPQVTPRPPEVTPEELVAVTTDGEVVVLSAEDGEVIRSLFRGALAEFPADVALSPDGQMVYFVFVAGHGAQAAVSIARIPFEGGGLELLAPGYGPAPGPDGRVAYVGMDERGQHNQVVIADPARRTERRWSLETRLEDPFAFVHSVAWTDDETLVYIIAFTDRGELYLLDTDDHDMSLWDGQNLPAPEGSTRSWVEFRPELDTLAFVEGCCGPEYTSHWRLMEMEADPDATPQELLDLGAAPLHLRLDMSGRHLLYVSQDGSLYRWSGGEPVLLAEGIAAAAWH